jgi:hypothetical protein
MIAVVLVGVGAAALAAGLGLLLQMGSRYRIARLLAAAREVPIPTAEALARAGLARYVLVHGRVTSDEEFPDELDRPLVFRWRRLEVRPPAGEWRVVDEEREAVPFGVEMRAQGIAVDAAQLGEGLVVLSREAEGLAAEVPERVPEGTDPRARVRHRILQVSAVEQASVVGVPILADGVPTMTAGLGRPLILTTLERPEAMRVLAGGHRGRMGVIAVCLGAGVVLVLAGLAIGLVQAVLG